MKQSGLELTFINCITINFTPETMQFPLKIGTMGDKLLFFAHCEAKGKRVALLKVPEVVVSIW